jgi:hypothetical protein
MRKRSFSKIKWLLPRHADGATDFQRRFHPAPPVHSSAKHPPTLAEGEVAIQERAQHGRWPRSRITEDWPLPR